MVVSTRFATAGPLLAPTIRSPSQCPGIAPLSTSAGHLEIGVTSSMNLRVRACVSTGHGAVAARTTATQ